MPVAALTQRNVEQQRSAVGRGEYRAMESSIQSHLIENDYPCHARIAVVCLPGGPQNLGPGKARLSDTVSP